MISFESLEFLLTTDGMALLASASRFDGNLFQLLDRLRKSTSIENASAILTTLDLRKRAKAKFELSNEMFFTEQGLEQASGDTIAKWRASKFPVDSSITDTCCGIGGDSMNLGRLHTVFAYDIDRSAAKCAKHNCEVANAKVRVQTADVTNQVIKSDFIFFDPSRRVNGKRVKRGEDYQPPLEFISSASSRCAGAAIKVSPGISDEELDALNGSVEFVSVSGECKEAIIWTGQLKSPHKRKATLLPSGGSVVSSESTKPLDISEPMSFLYEPDPAVIRAHLVADIGGTISGSLLNNQIAYITTDSLHPTEFATAYKIIEWMPFHIKNIQAALRKSDRQVTIVKKRGVPFEPTEIIKSLGKTGAKETILILTKHLEKPIAMICDLAYCTEFG